MADDITPRPEWTPIPGWDDRTRDSGVEMNRQGEALANRIELLRDNQERTPMSYDTLAEAEAAAATLPDGQIVDALDVQERYKVQGGVLVFDASLASLATPLDYQAKGDSVTNDDSAFAAMESDISDESVDLLGKTYLLSSYPRANKYLNGKFLIAGQTYDSEYNAPYNKAGVFSAAGSMGSRVYNPLWVDSIFAFGRNAMANMQQIRTGIAIGANALGEGTISRDNIAIGDDTLVKTQARTPNYDQAQKQGTRNVAIGGTAGRFIREGYGNVTIGRGSGQCLQDGDLNVALGAAALGGSAPVGLAGTIINPFPMNVSGCVALGANTLFDYKGTDFITAVGNYSLAALKKGSSMVGIGAMAGTQLDAEIASNGKALLWTGTETGTYSQAGSTISLSVPDLRGAVVGAFVGIRLTSGGAQTLQGDIVPVEVKTISGTTITFDSPLSLTTTGNAELRYVCSKDDATSVNGGTVIIGSYAMQNSSRGYRTVAIGAYTLNIGQGNSSTLAGYNVARNSSSVSFSTGIGNSCMGAAATYSACVAVGSGSLTTFIDGSAITGTLQNGNAIGTNATVSGNNQLQLGSSGTTTYAYGAIQDRSDIRDKTDLRDIDDVWDEFLMRHEVKQGRWDMRDDYIVHNDDGTVDYLPKDGSKARIRFHNWFIAQNVLQICQELGIDFAGLQHHAKDGGCDIYTIGYAEYIPLLLWFGQRNRRRIIRLEEGRVEQSQIIHELREKVKDQDDLIQKLVARIEKLEAR